MDALLETRFPSEGGGGGGGECACRRRRRRSRAPRATWPSRINEFRRYRPLQPFLVYTNRVNDDGCLRAAPFDRAAISSARGKRSFTLPDKVVGRESRFGKKENRKRSGSSLPVAGVLRLGDKKRIRCDCYHDEIFIKYRV